MLEFSIFYCAPCRLATPFLLKLKAEAKNKNFELFVIDAEKHSDVDLLDKYIRKEYLNCLYLINGEEVDTAYEVSAYSTFILVDKNKKIAEMIIGFNKYRLKNMIERIQ